MITVNAEDFGRLVKDVAFLKYLLLHEGELSPWAMNELEDARARSSKISHEDVKKMLLDK